MRKLTANTRPPQVILTTAYREYALEGFQLEVTDYLLKPLELPHFARAVNKAVKRIQADRSIHAPGAPPAHTPDHVFLKVNNKLVKVLFSEINYIEGMRGYVSIFVPGKRLVVYQKLNSMEAILPDGHFMRVHKSFIIALEKITAVEGNTAEIGDRRMPIGKSYRQEFFSRLPKA